MKRKNTLTVFLLLVMILESNGHHSILGNILSTAHKEIQSGVENVAGAVLGGFNLDVFGLNRPNRPQQEPQRGSEETIIVVVEEPGYNDYGPPNPNNHHHEQPQFNYDQQPHPHHQPPPQPPPNPNNHHHGQPPFNYDHKPHPPHQPPHGDPRPGYNDHNQDPYHNQFGNNQHTGNNQNELHNNNNNENIGNSENGDQPYSKGSEESHTDNNNPKNSYNDANTKSTEYTTNQAITNSSPLPINNEANKGTEKTSDDSPLFVPLSPNEYVYGGDKINITAPKRDTDKIKPVESDDEDFGIDVRLKNE